MIPGLYDPQNCKLMCCLGNDLILFSFFAVRSLEERVQIQKILPSLHDTIDDNDLALQMQVRRLQPVLWPKMAVICRRLLIWNARHFKIRKALVCFNPFILPRKAKFLAQIGSRTGNRTLASVFLVWCSFLSWLKLCALKGLFH